MKTFNERWTKCYEIEKNALTPVLERCKVISIDHVGATSVLFCDTNGTIDVLVSVDSIIDFATAQASLTKAGYIYLPKLSNDAIATYAHKKENKGIVSIVRVVIYGSLQYQEVMGFKYFLSSNIKNVRDYNDFRETLVDKVGNDYKNYNSVKSNYIKSILEDYCKFQ